MIDYALAQGIWQTPAGNLARFTYREGTNDWNTLSAILTHDEYHLPKGKGGVAVDIGGYLGGVAIAYALDNPDATVYVIEPVPPNLQLIRRNVTLNGLDARVNVIAGAVGGPDDREVTVWYGYRGTEAAEHHAFVGNSTLAYDNGGMLPHEDVTYRPITLASLLYLVGGKIDWLKIDTEGGEWSFLAGEGLESVEVIRGEWHPVRGHVQSDITDLIGETHRVTFDGPVEGPGGFLGERR